ncbi:DNA-binding protein [Nocardia sp. Marseille-Q1738]
MATEKDTTTSDDVLRRITSQPTASIDDTSRVLGVSRSTGYAAAGAGEWPVIRVRGRLRIPSAWVLRQLQLD